MIPMDLHLPCVVLDMPDRPSFGGCRMGWVWRSEWRSDSPTLRVYLSGTLNSFSSLRMGVPREFVRVTWSFPPL